MNEKEAVSIIYMLNRCSDLSQLQDADKKLSAQYDHPLVNSYLGQHYFDKGDKSAALAKFILVITKSITNHNYINTMFADTIGSTISKLFIDYINPNMEHQDLFTLFATGYYYLSNHIDKFGLIMYDSLQYRGQMIEKYENRFGIILTANYLGLTAIPKVLSIGDYYYSAIGRSRINDIQMATKLQKRAIVLHDWLEDITIQGVPADNYSLEDIANISMKRSKILYDNMSNDFEQGKFNKDFTNILNKI